MLKTALLTIQEFCYRINIPAPTAIAGATSPGDRQLLHTLYDVCEDMRRCGPFRPQILQHEFDTVASRSTYPLPGDFFEAVPCTQYNQDHDWRLLGPLTDAEFMAYKEGESSTPSEYVWRMAGFDENSASTVGRQLELFPVPAAVENLTFAYVTGHLFVPPKWTAGTAYTATTPPTYCHVNGRIYRCATDITAADTAPTGLGTAIADDDGTWDYFSDSYETVRNDGDYCLFDADVVKLGLRAKYLQDNDGSELIQQSARAEYERAKRSLSYRYEGQFRARGDRRLMGRHSPWVSPGSWTWA